MFCAEACPAMLSNPMTRIARTEEMWLMIFLSMRACRTRCGSVAGFHYSSVIVALESKTEVSLFEARLPNRRPRDVQPLPDPHPPQAPESPCYCSAECALTQRPPGWRGSRRIAGPPVDRRRRA